MSKWIKFSRLLTHRNIDSQLDIHRKQGRRGRKRRLAGTLASPLADPR